MRKIIYQGEKFIKDSGIFFGRGLFETILIKEKPEFLKFHINRLKEGLNKIKLSPLEENLEELIESQNLKNCVLKIVVTEENIIFTTRDIPYKKEDYEKGFNLTISNVFRNSTSIIHKIKSLNYLENVLEREKALEKGFNDCLFINEKGNVCETSTGNIFFVKDEKIYTPDLKEGLLNGTIRDFILKEFEVKLKNIKVEDLKNYDEIFMTNSIIGIMKIKKIDDYTFSHEKITSLVLKKYIERIRRV